MPPTAAPSGPPKATASPGSRMKVAKDMCCGLPRRTAMQTPGLPDRTVQTRLGTRLVPRRGFHRVQRRRRPGAAVDPRDGRHPHHRCGRGQPRARGHGFELVADSKWLAYSKTAANNFKRIHVWSMETGEVHTMTNPLAHCEHPILGPRRSAPVLRHPGPTSPSARAGPTPAP